MATISLYGLDFKIIFMFFFIDIFIHRKLETGNLDEFDKHLFFGKGFASYNSKIFEILLSNKVQWFIFPIF